MAGVTNFVAAQQQNWRYTVLLLIGLTVLAAGVGYMLGWTLEAEATDDVPLWSRFGVGLAGLMAVASLCWSGISLAFGDRMVLAMAKAHEIQKSDAPQLYNVVEEMAIAAGVPMPTVMVVETDALNAFATGTSTSHGTIAVTRGLLDTLNRDELQGVVGHEMAHLANLDTRYAVVVGVTVGLIALVCDAILRGRSWTSSSSSSSDSKSGGSGLAALLGILLIFVLVLAPLAAKFVQMAVSRQREYLADATSVQFTRNPEGLVSALRKLADKAAPFPGVSRATQHLFIVNPVQTFTKKSSALMATHPDIEDRIARLRNLGG